MQVSYKMKLYTQLITRCAIENNQLSTCRKVKQSAKPMEGTAKTKIRLIVGFEKNLSTNSTLR